MVAGQPEESHDRETSAKFPGLRVAVTAVGRPTNWRWSVKNPSAVRRSQSSKRIERLRTTGDRRTCQSALVLGSGDPGQSRCNSIIDSGLPRKAAANHRAERACVRCRLGDARRRRTRINVRVLKNAGFNLDISDGSLRPARLLARLSGDPEHLRHPNFTFDAPVVSAGQEKTLAANCQRRRPAPKRTTGPRGVKFWRASRPLRLSRDPPRQPPHPSC
jgi:hypothetical protein